MIIHLSSVQLYQEQIRFIYYFQRPSTEGMIQKTRNLPQERQNKSYNLKGIKFVNMPWINLQMVVFIKQIPYVHKCLLINFFGIYCYLRGMHFQILLRVLEWHQTVNSRKLIHSNIFRCMFTKLNPYENKSTLAECVTHSFTYIWLLYSKL